MTEEQIKQFPTNAEEYFYKQSKDGTPWKKEAMFISLGNEWKTAIYKAKQFLKESK